MAEKNSRGGKRVGAGRKKGTGKGTQRVVFQVSCQPEQLTQIEQLAQSKGITKSKLVLDCIFNQ